MAASLLVLPSLVEAPTANMATDSWMLRTFPQPECPRFRHYGWDRPCHTFGYGQDFEWVAEQTGAASDALCRRPSGGGVVDHRDDWTYAVVIPVEHVAAACQIRSTYQAVHRALGEAMASLGVSTTQVQPPSEKGGSGDFPTTPGHCFEEPVVHDLSLPDDGAKVAGAAIKKSREGLLLQGSIQKARLADLPWEDLGPVFAECIAAFLEITLEESDWPDDWETTREPFLKEIESIAWQRR